MTALGAGPQLAQRLLVHAVLGPDEPLQVERVIDTARLDDVLARTEGVTASFLKELLRRAALVAATRTPDAATISVSADDLAAALDELLDTRNAMTRTLLGAGDRG